MSVAVAMTTHKCPTCQALGNITIFVGTDAGLRELAAEIGFLEPKGTILLDTQGDYAGVSVALRLYQVDDQ